MGIIHYINDQVNHTHGTFLIARLVDKVLGFLIIRSPVIAFWFLFFFFHIIMVFKYMQKPRLARAFYSARRGLRSLLLCCYSFGKDYYKSPAGFHKLAGIIISK